jgi:predicted  nucleic acid-binding Zn-ribbon protein
MSDERDICERLEDARYDGAFAMRRDAARLIRQLRYYTTRLEEDLVAADLETESLREHIAQQQLDIVTLSGEMGRLRKALAKIAQYDMQFIAIDALCPDERIRENRRSDAHER